MIGIAIKEDGNPTEKHYDLKETTDAVLTSGTVLIGEGENSITFTNTYTSITPTGLALNIAPFVAMFAAVGAAIALYVAAKRRVR